MVLLSGGIDSATVLYLARGEGYKPLPLTFVYHGMARGELRAARAIARSARAMPHRLFSLTDLKESSDIAGGRFPGMPTTYIPMRNAIFYSVAAAYAEEVRAFWIMGGHNRDDLKVFRDVHPHFFRLLEEAFREGSKVLEDGELRILLPLSGKTKPEVVRIASSIGVPLGLTWSCHRNGNKPCWSCEGCIQRKRAFRSSKVDDPLDADGRRKEPSA